MTATLPRRTTLAAAALFSAGTFALELLCANVIVFQMGGVILWQCVTLGAYLGGMGLGAYLARSVGAETAARRLARLTLGAAWLAVAVVPVVYAAYVLAQRAQVHTTLDQLAPGGATAAAGIARGAWAAGFVAACEALAAGAGVLAGFELPLLMAAGGGVPAAAVLGCNYLGGLVGSLVYTLVLMPRLELSELGAVLAAYLALASLAFSRIARRGARLPRAYLANAGAALLAAALLFLYSPALEQLAAKVRIHYQADLVQRKYGLLSLFAVLAEEGPVRRIRTPYQRIEMTPVRFPKQPPVLTMFLDGYFQFSASMERFYHEAMAHLPLALAKLAPAKILVLGAGDGLLARELLRRPGVEEIRMIELDPVMVALAREDPEIRALNGGALDDPRVKVEITDALTLMRTTTEKFGTIYIDFPYPYNYDLAKLFSVEFYTWIRRALTPDGVVVINAPLFAEAAGAALPAERRRANSVMFSTLAAAGFQSVAPYRVLVESFVAASPAPGRFARGVTAADVPVPLAAVTPAMLALLEKQVFPHDIGPDLVNSVFRPAYGWLQRGFQ